MTGNNNAARRRQPSGRASSSSDAQIVAGSPQQASALEYAKLGWPVFPVHSVNGSGCTCGRDDCGSAGKHPRTRHGLKDATTDAAVITKWWRTWPSANVGIVTGKDAGIVVLDIDPRHGGDESLADLIDEHGAPPMTIEALTGGGGRHLIFAHPGGTIPNRANIRPGIDLRGDGGYIVAPPSAHSSGKRYTWRSGHSPKDIDPAVMPAWLQNLPGNGEGLTERREKTEKTESIETGERTEITSKDSGFCVPSTVSVNQPEIQAAIEATLPARHGERRGCLFKLARRLKAIQQTKDASVQAIEPIVREWHRRALRTIQTKPWAESWADFIGSWKGVKFPAGQGPIENAFARAQSSELPAAAQRYDDAMTRDLVALLATLQADRPDEPIYLACGVAAELFKTSSQTVSKRLRMLVVDGVLEVVEPGRRGRATRYRFVGGNS